MTFSNSSAGPPSPHHPVDDLGDLEVRVDLRLDASQVAVALQPLEQRRQIVVCHGTSIPVSRRARTATLGGMPLRGGGLATLIVLVMSVYCVLDIITTDPRAVRHLPKLVWLTTVLLVPLIGSLAWLLVGRPAPAQAPTARSRPRRGHMRAADASTAPRRGGRGPLAPDDDPEFLDQLRQVNDEHERMLKQWEADLRKREDDLRGDDASGTSTP